MGKKGERMGNRPRVMITWDIDPLDPEERMRESLPTDGDAVELQVMAMRRAEELCDVLGAKSTFFITASLANDLRGELERLSKAGHQIGCHGLSHADWEDYSAMGTEKQRETLQSATRTIHDAIGQTPNVFRAPRVTLSSLTLKLLEDLDYVADSSVSAGRLDFSSSFFTSPAQILAPRRPYHPHPANRFREGESRIWEIPVSARIIPFTSTALTSFGLKFMSLMFDRYASRRREAVYLIHPAEFLASPNGARPPVNWFIPSRDWLVHGLPFRYLLFRRDGKEIFEANMMLFRQAKERWNVDFLTIDALVDRLDAEGL